MIFFDLIRNRAKRHGLGLSFRFFLCATVCKGARNVWNVSYPPAIFLAVHLNKKRLSSSHAILLKTFDFGEKSKLILHYF